MADTVFKPPYYDLTTRDMNDDEIKINMVAERLHRADYTLNADYRPILDCYDFIMYWTHPLWGRVRADCRITLNTVSDATVNELLYLIVESEADSLIGKNMDVRRGLAALAPYVRYDRLNGELV